MRASPRVSTTRMLRVGRAVAALVIVGLMPLSLFAQRTAPPTDGTVVVTVRVQADTTGTTTIGGAIVLSS